jgi:hypothetical protein
MQTKKISATRERIVGIVAFFGTLYAAAANTELEAGLKRPIKGGDGASGGQ